MINRRGFLAAIIGLPFLKPAPETLDVSRIMTWDKTRIDFVISGVPYHQSNASTGTWLGLNRAHSSFWVNNPPQCRRISKLNSSL